MDLKICTGALLDQFEKQFGPGPKLRVGLAPGRVNLIGEHTDYNGGFVLPIAIDRHTAVIFRPNGSNVARVFSETLGLFDEFSLSQLTKEVAPARQWINYPMGIANALAKRKVPLRGIDMFICTDLPVGAGLSSSASLEIAVGLAFLDAAKHDMPKQELAICGQEAEHEFAGVRCGIMDQMIVATAIEGYGLLLDCKSFESNNIPISIGNHCFAIFDTGVRHKLASSEYNVRRSECEHVCEILGREMLRDVTADDLYMHIGVPTSSEQRRVRHNLSENVRVVQFASALKRGDVQEAGHLLKESHNSLRDDYEVSCSELDTVVNILFSGDTASVCAGARMTGGGFGGSVVALIKKDEFKAIVKSLGQAVTNSLLIEPGAGAAVFDLDG